jgi:hypothetical protein
LKKDLENIKTNLEVLTKSKDRPKAGDVFVFRPRGRDYYFGLVVNADIQLIDYMGQVSDPADWDGMLVYVYDQHSPDKTKIPELDLKKLLLKPLILDVYCWRLGYVETVGSVDLAKVQVLPRHCFVSPPLIPGRPKQYFDEHGHRLAEPTEPCGGYGLTPFRGFDDKISRALNILLVPN